MQPEQNKQGGQIENDFFELIDLEGKDDVMPDLEKEVERIVNLAVEFILSRPAYSV